MNKSEDIVANLYAISIVARKIARQLLTEMEEKSDVKNENVDRNQRRSRKSSN